MGRRDRIEQQRGVTATHPGGVAVRVVNDDALGAAVSSDPEATGLFAGLLQRAARCAAVTEPSPCMTRAGGWTRVPGSRQWRARNPRIESNARLTAMPISRSWCAAGRFGFA
jgi:hypothetical protein